MRKIHSLTSLSAAVLSLVTLASCGSTSDKTVVTFWGTFSSTQSSWVAIVNAFETAYPNIEINYVQQGGYPDVYSAVTKAIPAGNTPTMAYAYPDHVASYLYQNKAVVDMTPYMNSTEDGFGVNDPEITVVDETGASQKIQLNSAADDMVSTYIKEGQGYLDSNGEAIEGTYSLPWSRSTEVLFYDKTLFDSLGLTAADISTWEGVWNVTEKIMADTDFTSQEANDDGQKPAALAWDSEDNMFITLCEQLGIPYTDGSQLAETNGNPLLFGDDTSKPEVAKLLKFLKEKYDSNELITKTTNASGGTTYNDTYFQEGTLAMDISSTAGASYFTSSKIASGHEVGVVPLPTSAGYWIDGDGALPSTAKSNAAISQGPSVTFFKGASDAQLSAAWDFYKFATSDYFSSVWSGSSGYVPVRESSYSLSPMTDVDSLISDVYDVTKSYGDDDNLFSSDVFVGSADARDAVSSLTSSVLNYTGDDIDDYISDQIDVAMNTAAEGLPA